jgi:hypothetical protein
MARLENYPLLTPCVESRKANLYEVSTGAILVRFSNTAAVKVHHGRLGIRLNCICPVIPLFQPFESERRDWS